MNLQTNFIKFYNTIKFDQESNRKQLIAKRKQLVEDIRRYLNEQGLPKLKEVYNQGSYGVGTGTKPIKGRDFDIDVGLVFDIAVKDYKDPTVVKKWVEKAINRYHHGQAEMLPACVRVNYRRYHVDFAIYGLDNNVKMIAKGQKGSQANNKYWERSPSKKLKEKLKKNKLGGQQKAQYRRLIGYLKRWKDEHFKATTNEAPTGIALTTIVYQWLQPQFDKNENANDLKALCVVLKQAKSNQYGLDIRLPVDPKNKLFEDINQSSKHRKKYMECMKKLYTAVQQARQSQNAAQAAQLMREQFGSDFPI
jgi:hypothetical protein